MKTLGSKRCGFFVFVSVLFMALTLVMLSGPTRGADREKKTLIIASIKEAVTLDPCFL
jgi:hypothetical protein